MQRKESAVAAVALREQRAGHRQQRRRLVVASPERTRDPVKLRNLNGCAKARIGSIFADGMITAEQRVGASAAEVREPYASVQCQPARSLVLIFDKDSLGVAPELLAIGGNEDSAVASVHSEQLIVALRERLDAHSRGVMAARVGSGNDTADVV